MPKRINLDNDSVINIYNNGASLRKMKKMLGVSRCVIARVLKENGIAIRGPSKIVDDEIAEKTYRNKGWLEEQISINNKSCKEISLECGVNVATISKYITRNSVEHPGSGNRIKYIIGKRFGRLVVIGIDEKIQRKGKDAVWSCVCDCGNNVSVSSWNLNSGGTRSCGCLKSELSSEKAHKMIERTTIDMVGKVFGRWTVISQEQNPNPDVRRGAFWKCKCSCGGERVVRGDILRSGQSQSCGCLHAEIVAKQCGPMHPSWNPCISDEERIKGRRYPEYREWRKSVFKRDDYVCQKCGEKGWRLNSHHIESYDINKGLRTVLENGVTLCRDCHKKFHLIYGNGHNTREQFNEFMLMEDESNS